MDERPNPDYQRRWPLVDRMIGRLPARLLTQATLARHTLATWYAPDGQFAGVLTRMGDAPILDIHAWVLGDLDGPPRRKRALESYGFAWAALQWMGLTIRTHVADPDTALDESYLELADLFADRSVRWMRRALGAGSPWWSLHAPPPAPTLVDLLGASLAAVAYGLDRPEILPALLDIVPPLGRALELGRDVVWLRRDLAHGRRSGLITEVVLGAGLPLDRPLNPFQVLGALVLGPTLAEAGRRSQDDLARAAELARTAGLPSLGAYLDSLALAITGWLSSLKPGGRPDVARPAGPSILPPVPGRDSALSAAERYLLADPTFQESWEVQRHGLLGVDELCASAFPTGSILELLCRSGLSLTEEVDRVIGMLLDNGIQYFDNLPVAAPDADDLGLLLRLWPYSSQAETVRSRLAGPLATLHAAVDAAGFCPVWFVPAEVRARVTLWGDSCVTVSAQLARGLLAYDPAGSGALIDRMAGYICRRWLQDGLAANSYYAPWYAVWVLQRMLAEWHPDAAALIELHERTLRRLAHVRAGMVKSRPESAQDQALTLLTHRLAPAAEHVADGLQALIERQRYDGSWEQSPLYITGTRAGSAAWYSSRLVSSALCYHALSAMPPV
jgi:hypothetical protein